MTYPYRPTKYTLRKKGGGDNPPLICIFNGDGKQVLQVIIRPPVDEGAARSLCEELVSRLMQGLVTEDELKKQRDDLLAQRCGRGVLRRPAKGGADEQMPPNNELTTRPSSTAQPSTPQSESGTPSAVAEVLGEMMLPPGLTLWEMSLGRY